MKRRLISVRLFAVVALLALVRFLDPGALPQGGERPDARSERQAPPPVLSSAAPRIPDPHSAPSGELGALGDAERDAQIRRVVAAMDATGRPPAGVAQGGRKRGTKGAFDNLEGRLPRRPAGYYRESDVWPQGPGNRGVERLVFGREGEVYYTRDHYRSFTRLRTAR